ncbi:TonB-dependent receptor [Chitinophaga sedimenti]|uniref:TonB-dependent receptor domain-containing protein n=1 Tax=Chitinophaga sedimenti TaxID=2033606 RepID=UPI0020050539|nr:TonB-dependent receptor [Chitinophaga sedimenti]MCK7556291.1 TonB-dependent receptor [Chitinophaga sedimenti]
MVYRRRLEHPQRGVYAGRDWIRQLKLRAAYGFNGNVAKMSLPQVIAEAKFNTYTTPSAPSLVLSSMANSSLRWEQTRNFNIGLDYAVFKHVYGTLDYYNKRSTDLLGNAQIDPTIGTSPSLINRATIDNQGVEFALHADWIANDKMNWNTGLVLARNKSKVLEVYQRGNFNPQTLNTRAS